MNRSFKTLPKNELIRRVEKNITPKVRNRVRRMKMDKLPRSLIKAIINQLFWQINHTFVDDRKSVTIPNFGTFRLKRYKRMVFYDISRRAHMYIKPQWHVVFEQGRNVRKILNK